MEKRKVSFTFTIDSLNDPDIVSLLQEAKANKTISGLIKKAIQSTYIDTADTVEEIKVFASHREEFISLLSDVKTLLKTGVPVAIPSPSSLKPTSIQIEPEGMSMSDFMDMLN